MISEIDAILHEWARYYSGGLPNQGYNCETGEKLDKPFESEPSTAAAWAESVICGMPKRDRLLVINFYMSRYTITALENIKRATGLSKSQAYVNIDRIHRVIADKLYKTHAND